MSAADKLLEFRHQKGAIDDPGEGHEPRHVALFLQELTDIQ